MSIAVKIEFHLPYDACVEVLEAHGTYDETVQSVKGEDAQKAAVIKAACDAIVAGSIDAETLIALVPAATSNLFATDPNRGKHITFNAEAI